MPAFRFVINEVLGPVAGFEGPVVAGPVLDASGRLKVGDWLEIDAPSGPVRVQCAGFPLLNWGRGNWVSVALPGLPSEVNVLGFVAENLHVWAWALSMQSSGRGEPCPWAPA